MALKDKIVTALFQTLKPEYMRLEEEDGISGFVVSRRFEGISSMDRQEQIAAALQTAALTKEERREVLMIAGLTPTEYEEVGARIRVHEVKELADGEIEILLEGGLSDAEYVRGTLNNQKGVRTTEPKPVRGALGTAMSFRAKGAEKRLRTKALRVLKQDPYIEVLSNGAKDKI